jgi:hypothetical protein
MPSAGFRLWIFGQMGVADLRSGMTAHATEAAESLELGLGYVVLASSERLQSHWDWQVRLRFRQPALRDPRIP